MQHQTLKASYTKPSPKKICIYDKKLIVKKRAGQTWCIQSILSMPSNLNVNTINKYLELKASKIWVSHQVPTTQCRLFCCLYDPVAPKRDFFAVKN